MPNSLVSRLGEARVGMRDDLDVTRHVFRGTPAYVVRDPITFQSQRLSIQNYEVLVSLRPDRSLSTVFRELVGRQLLSEQEEEKFYQFVLALHGLGFLSLPISDSTQLYQRFQQKQQARRKEKFAAFLFYRIPCWNPDAFLDRTLHWGRMLFTRPVFFAWILMIGFAGYVAWRQADQLWQPLQGLLTAQNLPLLWITLVVLKSFHEFGHAYACKHFGGHVPEMGLYLILFTPCAYVDATASWGFTRRRDRIIVCLAGMYIESMFASVALLVWAMTEPSLIHSLAYNVIFLAGAVTILFNINPLVRYDGYYILSDLVEIPNLRERATRYLTQLCKRQVLRVPSHDLLPDRRARAILLTYGLWSTLYRVGVVLGIAVVLANKVFILGLTLALYFGGSACIRPIYKLTRYLCEGRETAHFRRRFVALAVLLLVVFPAAAALIPIPSHIHVSAIVSTEKETILRVKQPGYLVASTVEEGQEIFPHFEIAELQNDSLREELAEATSKLTAARIRFDAAQLHDPARALQENTVVALHQRQVQKVEENVRNLTVRAPASGRVIRCAAANMIGSYLPEGYPLATLVSGEWHLKTLLTSEEMTRTTVRTGDPVAFRPLGDPGNVFHGDVLTISTAGTTHTPIPELTQLAGGDIVIDPATGNTIEPLFEVRIALHDTTGKYELRQGMTGVVRFTATAESMGKSLGRRAHRFLNRLAQQ
ncbi:MAG: hypothetical protein AABZ47_08035 [Planctomycetota bacterium]